MQEQFLIRQADEASNSLRGDGLGVLNEGVVNQLLKKVLTVKEPKPRRLAAKKLFRGKLFGLWISMI